MRGFIQACAGVFVVIGAVVIVLGLFGLIMAASGDAPAGGMLVAFGAAGIGAAIVLVGGSTWVLAEIDARVERLGDIAEKRLALEVKARAGEDWRKGEGQKARWPADAPPPP